jgi:hypothetical protein
MRRRLERRGERASGGDRTRRAQKMERGDGRLRQLVCVRFKVAEQSKVDVPDARTRERERARRAAPSSPCRHSNHHLDDESRPPQSRPTHSHHEHPNGTTLPFPPRSFLPPSVLVDPLASVRPYAGSSSRTREAPCPSRGRHRPWTIRMGLPVPQST